MDWLSQFFPERIRKCNLFLSSTGRRKATPRKGIVKLRRSILSLSCRKERSLSFAGFGKQSLLSVAGVAVAFNAHQNLR